MLFEDILRMIFDSFKNVVSAFDVPLFMIPGSSVSISFWELLLGFLTVGIIFGFFLKPRSGSGLQTISNENKKANVEYSSQKPKSGGG